MLCVELGLQPVGLYSEVHLYEKSRHGIRYSLDDMFASQDYFVFLIAGSTFLIFIIGPYRMQTFSQRILTDY